MLTMTMWRLGGNLLCRSAGDEPHDGYGQVAIVGVMMGDTNAVCVLEMAHKRQLINAGVLRTDSLLLPERPLPKEAEFEDAYIDDLVLFSILPETSSSIVHVPNFVAVLLMGSPARSDSPCAGAPLSCT